MADILALVSVGSTLRKAIASDRVVYPGDVLVEGDVIIRGGEEVDSLETLMPLTGAEALRVTTQSAATALLPIRDGGYVQFGGNCWDGAGSVFGAGMRLAHVIDTQAAGVPATYHLEVNDRTGVEKWRIDQAGLVTPTAEAVGSVAVTNIGTGTVTYFRPATGSDAARGVALAAAIAASLAGDVIDIGPGDYLQTSTYTPKAGQTIRLHGARIYHATSMNTFYVNGVANVSITGAGIIEGAGIAWDGVHREAGIRVNGASYNFTCDGLTFYNFTGGSGFYTEGGTTTHTGGHVSNCYLYGNHWGVYIDALAEYWNLSAIRAHSNDTGIYINAGNTEVANSAFCDNTTGVYLAMTGPNGGHGIFSGCEINHNVTNAVYVDTVTFGMSFIGCHVFGGDVYLKACKGVNFIGGMIGSPTTITMNGVIPGYNMFKDVWFLDTDPVVTATAPQREFLRFEQCYTGTARGTVLNTDFQMGGALDSRLVPARGMTLENTTAADVVNTVQASPSTWMSGGHYTGGAAHTKSLLSYLSGDHALTDYYLDGVYQFALIDATMSSGNVTYRALTSGAYLYGYGGNVGFDTGTYFGIASQRAAFAIDTPLNVFSFVASGVAVRSGSNSAFTTEGDRLHAFMNASVMNAAVDKNGVYWNAYGSGQSVDAGTLAKTLITTLDDDSVYMIEARAEAIDQAGTPSHIGVWTGTIVARRIDGTVTIPVDTWTELYDPGNDWAATPVASTSTNGLVITTPAAGGAIGTVNWKIWFVRVMKTSSANYAGVTYPLAA